MKEIVVMSGKGGTGKTSIAAALGVLAGERAVVTDCDVDAANLHLLYEPERQATHEFWSGKRAEIDESSCSLCGICQEKCRFDAIGFEGDRYVVDPLGCEGCAVCRQFCPEEAIQMRGVLAGEWYESRSRFGNWLVHAHLGIGEGNSGKLVSRVKQEARKIAEREKAVCVIADGPPGIGCPVIASLTGADHVLIVTEATRSGLHDLRRLIKLIEFFRLDASCVINKIDLNEEVGTEIERLCRERGIETIATIPYSRVFPDSLQDGKTIVEMGDPEMNRKLAKVWDYLSSVE
jgi:MinD superfamily P-loop ATPase